MRLTIETMSCATKFRRKHPPNWHPSPSPRGPIVKSAASPICVPSP